MAAIQPTSVSIQKKILAFGNTSKLFSIIKTIGIIAVSILALSAGFYGFENCLLLLEKHMVAHGQLINLSPYLLKIGVWLQKIGRWLFLTISVPTYGICYELPKYFLKKVHLILENLSRLLNKIIIKMINFTYNFIADTLIPLITKIANLVFKIIDPCIKFIASCLNLLKKSLDQIAKVAVHALKRIYDIVFLPLAKWSFKAISYSLQTLYDKIIVPIVKRCFSLFKIAQRAFQYIYNHVIIKITDALSFALRKLGQKIQLLVNITMKAFHFLKNKLILPCLRWTYKVITTTGNAIFNNIIQPIFLLISRGVAITKPAFYWLYQKAIDPFMQAIIEGLRIIIKQFSSLSNFTLETIKNLFLEIKKVFEYLSSLIPS
ncbi:MAG: hypothetical protein HZB76_04235 [Chlamydiae bacterium]|nr:hypothetical protein [Chlamydiota bacterium]